MCRLGGSGSISIIDRPLAESVVGGFESSSFASALCAAETVSQKESTAFIVPLGEVFVGPHQGTS